MCDMFLFLLVCSCRLTPLGIWYHHMLHTNTTHCVWYVKPIIHNVSCSWATDGDTKYLAERDDMTIPVVKETYHTQCVVFVCNIWWYQIPNGVTHCVWYVSFTTGIVMSSLSFRYLVSPSVAHEHYTLCMIGFLYYRGRRRRRTMRHVRMQQMVIPNT
jgi:hypothetical protein